MADKKPKEMSRKELLRQDDAFIQAANEGASWLKDHKTAVIAGGVAVFLAAGLGVGLCEYASHKAAKASQAFFKGMSLKDARVVSEAEATPDGTPPTFAKSEDRDAAAKAAFESAIADAPSSGVADLARFYVADFDAKAGDTDKALAAFSELANRLSPKDNLYFLAVERVAYLKEQKGDIDGALAEWQKLLPKDSDRTFYGDHALYEAARLHAQKGEADKAKAALEKLEKDYAQSSLKEEAKDLLAQVGGTRTLPASDEGNAAQ